MMKQIDSISRHIASCTAALTVLKSEVENELTSKSAIGNAAAPVKTTKQAAKPEVKQSAQAAGVSKKVKNVAKAAPPASRELPKKVGKK